MKEKTVRILLQTEFKLKRFNLILQNCSNTENIENTTILLIRFKTTESLKKFFKNFKLQIATFKIDL